MPACFMLARVRTPSSPVREREKERERGRERRREIGREKDINIYIYIEREREIGRERERCRICPELLFLFLKGMTGALAPFSYPVII